ncbi:MAG: MFS transporter, partial [Candidatus Binataceae bacterium]
ISAIASPLIIGALSAPMGGLGNAVSTAAFGPILGAALVMWYAPETRGRTLEELEEVAAS